LADRENRPFWVSLNHQMGVFLWQTSKKQAPSYYNIIEESNLMNTYSVKL
jgi:hypothetical protein